MSRIEAWRQAVSDRSLASVADELAGPVEGANWPDVWLSALRDALPASAVGVAEAVARHGVFTTAHHVAPSHGPTFSLLDLALAASMPGPIVIGAWSAVPMSNSAISGAYTFGRTPLEWLIRDPARVRAERATARDRLRDGVTEGRLSVLGTGLRDAPVCGQPAGPGWRALRAAATEAFAAVVPEVGDSHVDRCLASAQGIARRLTGRDDLYVVDWTAVAATAWLRTADGFDGLRRRRERLASTGLSLFFERAGSTQRPVLAAVHGVPDDAEDRVAAGTLWTGLATAFGPLRSEARVAFVGGYRQAEWLETLADAWGGTGVAGRCFAGRLRDASGREVWALDAVMGSADPGEVRARPMSSFFGSA